MHFPSFPIASPNVNRWVIKLLIKGVKTPGDTHPRFQIKCPKILKRSLNPETVQNIMSPVDIVYTALVTV